MPELPAIEVGGEDPLQHGPPEMPLERMQPQRRLVVGDKRCGARPVAEGGSGLDIGLGVVAITGQAVVVHARHADVPEHPGNESSEVALRQVVRFERLRDDARRGERVQPFVHPGVLELVGADDPVPPLVAGLVDRDRLGLRHAARGDPPAAGREQGRVFHAAAPALVRRIDNGDMAVRICAKPLTVVLEGGLRRGEVAILLAAVLRLQQQPHLGARQRRVLERSPYVQEARARRPREVVHVLRPVCDASWCRRGCRAAGPRRRMRRRRSRAAP